MSPRNDGHAAVRVTGGQARARVTDGHAQVRVTGGEAGVALCDGHAQVLVPQHYEAPRLKEVTLLSVSDAGPNEWVASVGHNPHYWHICNGVDTPSGRFLSSLAGGEEENWNTENAPGDLVRATKLKVRVLIKSWVNYSASNPQFNVKIKSTAGAIVYNKSLNYLPCTNYEKDFGWLEVDLTPSEVDDFVGHMLTTGNWGWLEALIQIDEYEIQMEYEF